MSLTATITETVQKGSPLPDLVPTTLNYYKPTPDGSKPFTYVDPNPATGNRDTNWERDTRTVFVENVRGHESEYSLDVSGFEYHKGATALKPEDFNDNDTIRRAYYPESEEYLKKVTGATKVVLFDHTVRRNRPGETDTGPEKRQPVQNVHGDQTAASARVRVKRHLPEAEAEEILQSGRRFQIVNLWRPIENPAIDFPLALCDFRSINPERDLITHRIVFASYEGETLQVRHNESHKWKYLRGHTPNEFVLIKCYDSKYPEVSLMTAHTAFVDPTTPHDAPKRQSIELRALLFY